MIIDVINQQSSLNLSTEQIKRLVKEVIQSEGQSCHEVAIHFVDTPTICELHKQFFDDPSPTDCISFPIDDDDSEEAPFRLLGEIFVCPATAIEYAQQHQTDPLRETSLYIVHGLLHLMGYDDIEEEDIAEMRDAEKWHMERLQSLNLLLL